VAELSREEMRRLARLGAQARLVELRREESNIRRAFPELFRAGTRPIASLPGDDGEVRGRRRRRTRMSATARKAVSERMKKYWAERRKAKK